MFDGERLDLEHRESIPLQASRSMIAARKAAGSPSGLRLFNFAGSRGVRPLHRMGETSLEIQELSELFQAPGSLTDAITDPGVAAPALPKSGRARLVVMDGVAVTAATMVTFSLADHGGPAASPLLWAILFGLFTMFMLRRRGLYRFRLRSSPFDELGSVAACTATSVSVLIVLRSLVAPDLEIAGETIGLWGFVTTFLVTFRAAKARWVRRAGHQGRALIIGAGAIGTQVGQRLLERPEFGLRPVGFLDKEPRTRPEGSQLPVLGASWDLERQVFEHKVTHVILAFSTAPHHVQLDILRRCHQLGVEVLLVPRLFEKMNGSVQMTHLGGMTLLNVTPIEHQGWRFRCKYVLDRLVAALALLVLSPLMLMISLAVRLTSPGPVFYRQRRVSCDGHDFEMLKFRTMYDSLDFEGAGGPVGGCRAAWAAAILHPEVPLGELVVDRRTPLGRFLRRCSLDELPQFINVLRGDMSLVGPRPETPLLVKGFEVLMYRYGDRHRVKCGITGWAQVHGLRGDTSLRDRVEWDNYYIENWSPWLDLKILVMTIPATLRGRHAD